MNISMILYAYANDIWKLIYINNCIQILQTFTFNHYIYYSAEGVSQKREWKQDVSGIWIIAKETEEQELLNPCHCRLCLPSTLQEPVVSRKLQAGGASGER